MQRRTFLASSAAALPLAAAPTYIKSICNVIFAPDMPLADQFRAARNAGFEGIEIRLGRELKHDSPKEQALRVADAARKAGVAIASIWVSQALAQTPLNHPDAAVRARGVAVLDSAIDLATWLNCGAILIVPGRVGNGAQFVYGYQETWDRVIAEMRKVVAHSAKAKVYLTPENISNRFLVSPRDMRDFVDQFQSPWVQAHLDTGNMVPYGYPQDWIATLGKRVRRLHVKDYKVGTRTEAGRSVPLGEGDVDWKAVMAALRQAGYQGFCSPEYGYQPDDPEHAAKVSRALDRILALS